MKAPTAQAVAEASSAPGCVFSFSWGLEILKKIHFKKLGFRLGPDFSRLPKGGTTGMIGI
jgi:hypothetical protein